MRVETDRPLETHENDVDVQVLFPEAKARRRRLRLSIALLFLFVLVIGAIAIDKSGLVSHKPTQATAGPGTPPLSSSDRISSVQFTETREVPATRHALLFDSSPLVKYVVDTTLGSNAPSGDSESYYTSWTRNPTIYTSKSGFEKNGVLFVPNQSSRLQICTSTGANKVCSVTTKRWIEERPSQLRSGAIAPKSLPQNLYDPTKLFSELRATVETLARVGTSQIAGVNTTEYRGSIPAQNRLQLSSAPIPERPILQLAVSGDAETLYGGEHGGQPQQSITVSFKSVPLEVWVDRNDVVRQVRIVTSSIGFKLANQHLDQVVPLTVTLSYTGFNKPIAPRSLPSQDVFVVHGRIVSQRSLPAATSN